MLWLSTLWLPILLSSVIVFVVSSIIHMVLPWHKSDFPKLPNEEKVMDALRPLAVPPGDYMIPRPSSTQEMRSPEFAEKMKRGPVMVLTMMPNGPIAMGKNLVLRRHWNLGGVCRRDRAARWRALPSRFPVRRGYRVYRILGGSVADVDLVSARLAPDVQGDRGRVDLRPSDRRHVRLAVAALDRRHSFSPTLASHWRAGVLFGRVSRR
jgi:hypothetical protein